ncbi:MAG: carbonic anhydrase [Candidatus Omnitrophota bacterium]|jgi:carbonic anhydrase
MFHICKEERIKVRNFRAVFFAVWMIVSAALVGPVFAGEGTSLNAEEALALLKEGNSRFVAMKIEHPDENTARREETSANGQKPFAAVLGCADSRVPVEIIFDRGIGDIFVVRVAGNIAMDSSVTGSLEYAVGHLKVPLLVVLGHTQCGAVGAAVSGAKLEGGIRDIQEKIEPVVKEVEKKYPDLQGPALTNEVVKQNIFQTEKDLLSGSEAIRGLAAQGALKIVPAVYDVMTGKVDWLEKK